ncbi:MAG: ArsR/SmtB family transcription factor [Clostridia bacterium]
MKLLHLSRKRETYEVVFSHSLLFECALGIAAATYPVIHASLEKPASYWLEIKASLSATMQQHLDYVEQNNTWKTLLQLLHLGNFHDLDEFLRFVRSFGDEELLFYAYPFLGESYEPLRRQAAQGDASANTLLIESCKEHKFFPDYLRFLQHVDVSVLREHLLAVMEGWYLAQIIPKQDELEAIFSRDLAAKRQMQERLDPEAFVEWVTCGIRYAPEPSVSRVILVPHTIYRPWNVQADCPGAKVFYYPVADESLVEIPDPYTPPTSLVLKHKALGDEHRLRLVKLLAERELSLQELTEKLSLAKSTVHHHLMLLRSARLVEATGNNKYRLDRKELDWMNRQLDGFLQRGLAKERLDADNATP